MRTTRTEPPTKRPAAAGHVLVTMFVGLLVAGLLNAPSLRDSAEAQEYGIKRTVALAFARPLAAVSSALRLDVPRLAADRALGRGTEVTEVAAPPSPEPEEHQPVLALRVPSAAEPMRTWIIGDSLMELLGVHLARMLGETGVVEAEVDFRYISGLMRPDHFDWPRHMRRQMPRLAPDAVVVMFGGNDGQSVAVDGVVYEAFEPDWLELYGRRVGQAMDLLRDARRVYWIGLPIMKSDTFSARARLMNEVYRSQAAERPWVLYVETWDVFADRRGRYSDYLPDAGGNMRLMRYADGVHFTPHGAVRLARHVLREAIAPEWRLPED